MSGGMHKARNGCWLFVLSCLRTGSFCEVYWSGLSAGFVLTLQVWVAYAWKKLLLCFSMGARGGSLLHAREGSKGDILSALLAD